MHALTTTTSRLTKILSLFLLFCFVAPLHAQEQDERRIAFEMFAKQRFDEVVPRLEKLADENPNDGEIIGKLGLAVMLRAISLTDEEKHRKERVRARSLMVRAKALGYTDDLLELALSSIAPDGSEVADKSYSENKEADALIREGGRAFARHDYEAALKAYVRAAELDPQLYYAPLFAGDAYLQQGKFTEAGEWYTRAIRLQPDTETAYRYWGNALMRQGNLAAAREKYIEAIIAEPYNGYVWRNGIVRWAEATRTTLGHPRIETGTNISQTKDNQMTITIDPQMLTDKSNDGRSAWMIYGLARAAWTANDNASFRKAYPAEKEYRHSLAEEAGALRMVVENVRQQQKERKIKKLAPELEQLVRIHDEGLLEAYVLFAGADEGIAQDYAEYRKTNRDKLRRYLFEYVTSGRY